MTLQDILKKRIIKVRYVESKAVDGRIPREMKEFNSNEGKLLNINIAAFIDTARTETLIKLRTHFSNLENDKFVELKKKLESMNILELLNLYKQSDYITTSSGERYHVDRLESDRNVEQLINMIQRLKLNKYID